MPYGLMSDMLAFSGTENNGVLVTGHKSPPASTNGRNL